MYKRQGSHVLGCLWTLKPAHTGSSLPLPLLLFSSLLFFSPLSPSFLSYLLSIYTNCSNYRILLNGWRGCLTPIALTFPFVGTKTCNSGIQLSSFLLSTALVRLYPALPLSPSPLSLSPSLPLSLYAYFSFLCPPSSLSVPCSPLSPFLTSPFHSRLSPPLVLERC